jgi:hypothetical protein
MASAFLVDTGRGSMDEDVSGIEEVGACPMLGREVLVEMISTTATPADISRSRPTAELNLSIFIFHPLI